MNLATNYIFITIIAFMMIIIIIIIFKLHRTKLINTIVKSKLHEYEDQLQSSSENLKLLQDDNKIFRNRIENYIEENSSYVSKIEYLSDYSLKLEKDLNILNEKFDSVSIAKYEAEAQAEITRERLIDTQRKIDDWEKARQDNMQHAKAAIFEVGNQLSSRLIEEHKRETEEARIRNNKSIAETSEKLNNQFENIVKSMASLHSQIADSKENVDIVKRALLTPGGAGSLAEITLENILKASGLIMGQDFFMQYNVVCDTNTRLRPDAIIFLPGGNIMIIDSKASKFFLEIAAADSREKEKVIYEKLKSTMRTHLKSLANKDYLDAVRTHLKSIKSEFTTKNINIIMFLPSETALEKLHAADLEFIQKAWEMNIFPAGPVGIINILNHAKFQITEEKQWNNSQLIIDEVKKLIGSIGVISEYAKKMGNAIQSAASNYDKFAGSFNSNLLIKSFNLQKMGINIQSNKSLPQPLERYQIVSTNPNIIETDPLDKNHMVEEIAMNNDDS